MSVNCNQSNPKMKYSKFEDIITQINNGMFTPDAACSILSTVQKDLELCADYQLFVCVETLLKKLIEAYKKTSHLSNLINVFVTKLKREDSVYYSMEDSENFLYNIKVLKIIARNHSDDNLLFEALHELNRTQLIKAMVINSKDGPTEICFKFVHSKLIPEILSQNLNYDSKKEIIDFIFAMPLGFAYQYMNDKQIKDFKGEIIDRYLPALYQKNSLSSNWWIYCKLLIYFCGKILHSEKEITNAILRLVEQGFKSRGTTDKLGCFECWKTLIENYYLDQRYLKNHLRLLLQPLKLKFGWSIEIFEVRFQCYLSLLEKLENPPHACIEEYLTAIIISFSDEDANNIKALTPGQPLKDIFTKATEVLLKLLGHDRETCCKNKEIYLTNIYKIKPYLNSTLLNVYAQLFVNSVRICSEMTLLWSHGKDREILINCLWSSLFNWIQYSSKEGKGNATLTVIKQNFQIIAKKCLRNEKYYDVLLSILKSFTNFLDKGTVKIDEFIYKELLLAMVMDVCTLQSNNQFPFATTQEILKNLLDCCKQENSFIDDIQTNFLDNKWDYAYCQPVVMYTAKNISTILNQNNSTQDKRKFVKSLSAWCLENDLPKLWESVLKNGSILAITDMKMVLVSILKEAAQQNNGLVPRILKLCCIYLKMLSKKDGLVFIGLIDVIMICYSKENLDKEIKCDIATTLKTVVEAKKQHDFEVNINFYQCFENVLTLHKAYEVLVVLSDFMEGIRTNKNLNFPKPLENIVNNFSINSDMEYKKSAQKIMIKLENLNNRNTALNCMSRAAKITSLANENLKSNHLNFFATHLKSNSPVRFKGHQVDRDLTKYLSPKNGSDMSPKTKKTVNLNDLDEKDFVIIDKKVEIVLGKLSENQIEKTKKRRDDIPALYQDLTQSSMDMNIENNENVLETNPCDSNKINNSNIETEKTSDLGSQKRKQIFENIRKDESDDNNKTNSELVLPDGSSNGSGSTGNTNSLDTPRKRRGRKTNSERERMRLFQNEEAEKKNDADDENGLSKAAQRALHKLRLDIVGAEEFRKELPKRIVKKKNNENFLTTLPSRRTERAASLASDKQHDVTSKQTKVNVDPVTEKVEQSDYNNKVTMSYLTENNNGVGNDLNNPTDLGSTINDLKEVTTIYNFKNTPDTETLDMFPDETDVSNNRNSDTITQSFCEESKLSKVSDMDTESLSFTNSPTNICDSVNKTNKISEMDTESLSITSDISTTDFEQKSMEDSPSKDKNNLQCSPVTNETPTRKKELLNNTSDISPIKLDLNISISTPQKKSPDIFSEVSEDYSKNLFETETNIIGNKPRPETEIVATDEKCKNLVRFNGVPTFPPKTAKCLEFPSANLSSPKTDRIKKMMLNCEQNRIGSELRDDNDLLKMNNNVLKFDREVPSPLATPKASILKRKAPEDPNSGGLSPFPKRKRVNFSDPPTTCEKIYYKEEKSNFRKVKKRVQGKNSTEKETSTVDFDIEKSIPFPFDDALNGLSPLIDNTLNSSSDKNNVINEFNWFNSHTGQDDSKCEEMDDIPETNDLSGISIHLANETMTSEKDLSNLEEIPANIVEKNLEEIRIDIDQNKEDITKIENDSDQKNVIDIPKRETIGEIDKGIYKSEEIQNLVESLVNVILPLHKTVSKSMSKEHYSSLIASCIQQSECYTDDEKERYLNFFKGSL